MNDDIKSAVERAAERARAQQSNTVPATTQSGGTVPVPQQPGLPAQRMALDDFTTGMLSVDDWLQVNEFGLSVKTAKAAFVPQIEVTIDLNAIAVCEMVKFSSNPVIYLKTYDRINCVQGGSWADACARAKQYDNSRKTDPYKSADIPMTLDVEVKQWGDSGKPGTLLGHNPSTTNGPLFERFLRACREANLYGEVVRAKLYHIERQGKGNTWGVIGFELLGPSEE